MLAIAELIRQSTVIYMLLASMSEVLMTVGFVFVALGLFRLEVRKHPIFYVLASALPIAVGVLRPWAFLSGDPAREQFLTTFGMIAPYLCMLLIFRKKGVWKSLLVVLGYPLLEAVKYVVLMLFFHYDNENVNDPLETLIEFLLHVGFFLVSMLFLTRYVKRHEIYINLTKGGIVLFVLIVATVTVFIASLALLSSRFDASQQVELAFTLLNIPLVTATITVAVTGLVKSKARSEQYKAQLDAQLQYYAMMEQMNEDLRQFRHDLPKKVRPLIAYLDENRNAEAREIAAAIGGDLDGEGVRYHTGNYRLDTVLFCQQQIAQKDDITIEFAFGGAFPPEGIEADDLYTIFPNALDNAIEACRKVEGERKITLHSKIIGDTVYVTIENPVAGKVTIRHGIPQTDKADKTRHGFGFRSMKKAAAKYGDDNLTVSAKDGVFTLQMALRFEQPQPVEPEA